MGLKLAVAGSNLSHQYGLPAFFVAIAVDSRSANNLPALHVEETKARQTRGGGQDPFDLTEFETGLFPHLEVITSRKIIEVKRLPKLDTFSESIRAYHTALNGLVHEMQQDLRTAAEPIDICLLKLPINNEHVEMPDHEAKMKFQSSFYPFPISWHGRGSEDSVLGMARLLARHEYSKIRRTSQLFVNAVLKNEGKSVFQFLRLTWNSPPIDTYPDSFVGYPNVFFRKDGTVQSRTLQIGDGVSILPIARYCIGPSAAIDEPIATCLHSSSGRPFGAFLEGSSFDRCDKCGGKNDPLRLVQRFREGHSVLDLLEPGLSERIILGNYSIYITRFGQTIKVGRTMQSRTVPRLLEQGASTALVFYPVQTIETAARVEVKLTEYLKAELEPRGLAVTGTAFVKTRLEHISNILLAVGPQSDPDLYFEVIRLVENCDDPELSFLNLLERRVIDLTRNWMLPGPLFQYELLRDPQFRLIQGVINGFAGPFLLVDNKIVNTEPLAGYVVRDNGTKHNQS